MSITTYAELQTAVGAWLNRSDLSTQIPDFIDLAEARMTRLLRLRGSEQLSTTTYGAADTTRRVGLPQRFKELLVLSLKGPGEADDQYCTLTYKDPESFVDYRRTGSGEPECYTVRDEIELDVLAGAEYTLRMYYLKGPDIATDLTNTVLTRFPDIYLYGALAAAEPYIKNEKRVALWKSLFEEAIREANTFDDRTRDQTEMVPDPLAAGIGGWDILRDRW